MFWTAISIGASLLGSAMSARAKRDAGEASLYQQYRNAEIERMNADFRKETQYQKADKIREAAFRFRSQQVAQQAASGVVVGEGSAQIMLDDTTKLAEQDALIEIYSGINDTVAAEANAGMMEAAGRNMYDSAQQSANATLLSGIGNAFNTYHSYKALSTPRMVSPGV